MRGRSRSCSRVCARTWRPLITRPSFAQCRTWKRRALSAGSTSVMGAADTRPRTAITTMCSASVADGSPRAARDVSWRTPPRRSARPPGTRSSRTTWCSPGSARSARRPLKSRFDTSGAKRALGDRRMGAVGVRSVEFDRLLALAPDRMSHASHQLELALLLFMADPVALDGRSEPTLRAERQSLERDVARGLRDPLLEIGLGFELRLLGRHEAKHGDSIFR